MMSVDDDDWLNEKRSERQRQRQRTALLTESRRRLQRAVDDQQFADVTRPLDTQALHPPRRRDVTAAAANQRVSVGRALKPRVVR